MQRAKAIFAGAGHFEEIGITVGGAITWNGKEYAEDSVIWAPPATGTIYGTLLNFQGQLAEMGDAFHDAPYNKPPKKPILYIKPENTLSSHRQPVPIPEDESEIQVGAALGVVIGRTMTNVPEAEALDFVEGYTIVNDVSIPHASFYRPDIKNKVRDGFCPVGPWITERDAVANPDALDINVFLNGQLVQENNTKNLVRSVSRLLAEVTDFMTLYKGDMLLAGVPEKPPLARAGDVVRLEVPGVGVLENTFVYERDILPGGGKR